MHQKQEHFLQCHRNAFTYFNGVPESHSSIAFATAACKKGATFKFEVQPFKDLTIRV